MMDKFCPYNVYINCPEQGRKCDKCGWNPEVEAKRKKAVKGNG